MSASARDFCPDRTIFILFGEAGCLSPPTVSVFPRQRQLDVSITFVDAQNEVAKCFRFLLSAFFYYCTVGSLSKTLSFYL